jgi:hypothetical protein
MSNYKLILCHILIGTIFIIIPSIAAVGKEVANYKYERLFHTDNQRVYYFDAERKVVFAHSKDNCSIVQKINISNPPRDLGYRYGPPLIGDEDYFFLFFEDGEKLKVEVINKSRGEKTFSQTLNSPIYIEGKLPYIT